MRFFGVWFACQGGVTLRQLRDKTCALWMKFVTYQIDLSSFIVMTQRFKADARVIIRRPFQARRFAWPHLGLRNLESAAASHLAYWPG